MVSLKVGFNSLLVKKNVKMSPSHFILMVEQVGQDTNALSRCLVLRVGEITKEGQSGYTCHFRRV